MTSKFASKGGNMTKRFRKGQMPRCLPGEGRDRWLMVSDHIIDHIYMYFAQYKY